MSDQASNVTATPRSARIVAKRKCQRLRRSARTSDTVAPPCSAAYSNDCVSDVVLISIVLPDGRRSGGTCLRGGGHELVDRATVVSDNSTRTYYASHDHRVRFDNTAFEHDRIVHSGGG